MAQSVDDRVSRYKDHQFESLNFLSWDSKLTYQKLNKINKVASCSPQNIISLSWKKKFIGYFFTFY